MKFLRCAKVCLIMDKKRNDCIKKELGNMPMFNIIKITEGNGWTS